MRGEHADNGASEIGRSYAFGVREQTRPIGIDEPAGDPRSKLLPLTALRQKSNEIGPGSLWIKLD